ncbi:MAG: type II toxin-antitoxin system VapC family toxin [Dehalococcoidia bacterium]|jgi:predicted nucleic acid-binding protein|nr:type II toxin-antitoxin system VapC family toxin [Dehalococcoidia bacterium]
MIRFLDTNILLQHLAREDEQKAIGCRELLLRLERGEEVVVATDIVIFEAVYILQSRRHYGLSRSRIRQLLEPIIALRGLRLPRKALYARAFDLYDNTSISFADAYNAAYMESRGLTEVYSYDTDFDRVEGITRVEPEG